MSGGDNPYCSDCAWPHECAANHACERRARGEIRSPRYGNDHDPVQVTLVNSSRESWHARYWFETTPAWLKANPSLGVAVDDVKLSIIGIDLATGPDMSASAEWREGVWVVSHD